MQAKAWENSRRKRRVYFHLLTTLNFKLSTLNLIVPRITCITRIWQAKAWFLLTRITIN